MATSEIGDARNGDVHIAYEVQGDGGVDVLRIGASLSNFFHIRKIPILTRTHDRLTDLGRLINYDNRGTGLSDRVRASRLPALEERMDDLRAVLDAAGMQRAVVTCFSDGGPLGCLFAATHPRPHVGIDPVQHTPSWRVYSVA